ncbi:MAG: hypothetical protein PHF36_08400 [Candidatus Cloacimonetes bacterium]|nr:hypothetical protein [Candidatus Cloacimonadota bacterium]
MKMKVIRYENPVKKLSHNPHNYNRNNKGRTINVSTEFQTTPPSFRVDVSYDKRMVLDTFRLFKRRF